MLLVRETASGLSVVRFVTLVLITVGYAEFGARSQRLKRYLGSGKIFSNPMSVWSFAAVLVLPAGWAAAFVVAQYVHSATQRRRERSGNAYRVLFTAAVCVLAQLVAAAVLGLVGDAGIRALHGNWVAAGVVVAAAASFLIVNTVLLVAGMYLAMRPPTLRAVLPSADPLLAEASALLLGVIAACFLLQSPALLPITIVLTIVLHRSTAVKALHHAARTDAKTGLLTAAAWSTAADGVLTAAKRTGGAVAVLLIDLDDFKAINDRHGHLAGDRVLEHVGACLRREMRECDTVGRFGGDEFAAILAGIGPAEAMATAERIRAAVRGLSLDAGPVTTSVGVTHRDHVAPDVEIDDLLAAADHGLYAAKEHGRNRVAASGSSAAA